MFPCFLLVELELYVAALANLTRVFVRTISECHPAENVPFLLLHRLSKSLARNHERAGEAESRSRAKVQPQEEELST